MTGTRVVPRVSHSSLWIRDEFLFQATEVHMFKPVSPKLNITSMEDDILRFWKKNDVFHKSADLRRGGPEYVFFEGPPTANGRPGVHHVLARAFKDIFPRYKTMRGFHVSRRGGWDTHGLPVEIEVEKKLGFTNKQQIEDYGIDKFNELCRESVFEYIQEWERLTDRIGYWVDLKTPTSPIPTATSNRCGGS